MPTSYNLTVGTPDTTPGCSRAHARGAAGQLAAEARSGPQEDRRPRPEGHRPTIHGHQSREPRSDHARRAQPLTGVTRGLTRLA